MFVFNDVSRSAVHHLMIGRNIRVIGPPLSGRSMLLQSVVDDLEARGFRVLQARGSRAASGQSGFLLEQLGNAPLAGTGRSLFCLLSATRETFCTADPTVIALDDADLGDQLSLTLIEEATRSHNVHLIQVASKHGHLMRPQWPEISFEMPTLTFDQLGTILSDRLGGVVSTSLVARVLSKSGGNPGTAVIIAESAQIAGLITLQHGMWELAAPSLWNSHLEPFARWWVQDLSADELSLLRAVAVTGPHDLEDSPLRDSPSLVRALSEKALVRLTRVGTKHALVYAWPPVVADFLRRDTPLDECNQPKGFGDHAAGAFAPTPISSADETATVARVFQLVAEYEAPAKFSRWLASQNSAAAREYLQAATGSTAERTCVEYVLSQATDADHTGPSFSLCFARAQWYAFEQNDLQQAVDVLREFGQRVPEAGGDVVAGQLLLEAFIEGIPSDHASRLSSIKARGNGFVPFAGSLLHLFSGDLESCRTVLDENDILPAYARSFVSPLLSLYEGDALLSGARAAANREQALVQHNRMSYVAAAYASTISALWLGRLQALSSTIASTLAVGEVTGMIRPVFGSILNIGAINGRLASNNAVAESLMRDATVYVPQPGPLYGSGTDLTGIIERHMSQSDVCDVRFAEAVRSRVNRGWGLAALSSAFLGVVVHQCPETTAQFRTLGVRNELVTGLV